MSYKLPILNLLKYLTYSVLIITIFAQQAFGLPAFPGAEGFGTETPGGRGGRVIAVTNLNDSGPGSLRAALTVSGPRIVVFRVAGTIELKSRLELTEPYLTVAGQTAPGGGITITRHPTMETKGLMAIRTHNVVMRYLRLRNLPPTGGSGQVDAVTMYSGSYNVVIDHCSFSWGTDEVFQTDGVRDFTLQWSIIAEGLGHSTHDEGEHSKGLHFRGANSGNISVHHNLLAHHMDRLPNINNTGTVDYVNNVMYNGGEFWTMIKDVFGEPNVNAIGNYYKRGPDSWDVQDKPLKAKGYEISFYKSSSSLNLNPKLYVQGNIGFHRSSDNLPEELIVEESSRFMLVNKRFTAPPITTVSASEAFNLVLGNAGATLPVRDAHDQRIVNDVRNGTGRIINDPSEVGGLLVIASGTPPVDTDGDGMPDEWEKQHGLNLNDPADRNQDRNGDGYTNIEEYLNSLVQSNSSSPVAPIRETPPEEDKTPPSVSVSSPKDGSTVFGSVTVSATATDMESGIAGVQFKLDGNDQGAEVGAAPFSVIWDTTSVTPGTYSLSAVARDKAGNEKESSQVLVVIDDEIQKLPLPSSGTLFVTTSNSGGLTNGSQCDDIYLSYGDEDILAYNTASKCWSLYFEGFKVGLDGKEIDAFHILPDGSILFSLYASATLPDVGKVATTDIVRFIPISLGKDTAGSFELYLKGASVGLDDTKNEKIDAIGILPDGRLVVSTGGSFNVSGISGKNQDLIAFNAISLGKQTHGTWELYFDGSKVGLGEVNVNGVWIDGNGHIYFTAKKPFSVAGITGDSGDILKCTLGSTGANTSCTYEFIWDSVNNGLPSDVKVNGIHLAP